MKDSVTLADLSCSQAAGILQLTALEAQSLPVAVDALLASADRIAEAVAHRLGALPGPSEALKAQTLVRVRRRLGAWLVRMLVPWSPRSESRIGQVARVLVRGGVPATHIMTAMSIIQTKCLEVLLRAEKPDGEFLCDHESILGVRKRLALTELTLMAAYNAAIRQQMQCRNDALEAKARARSVSLRSTVCFSQAIADEVDESQVITTLADHVMRIVRPEHLVIHTIEPGDFVEPRLALIDGKVVAPPAGAAALALRGDWQKCRAARTGHSFCVKDVARSLVKCPCQEVPQTQGSYACIPLAGGIRVHGWMHLTRREINGFSDDEMEVLSVFGQMVGTAITSLRLVRENRHQATTDPLTGLYNRRHFQTVLAKEELLQKRRGGNVGLVMLDVDRFKQFNDTYGHDTGDRVLTALAAAIRDSVRATDEVARLGGDEFVILLRDCDAEASIGVAEKIVRRASEASIRLDATTHASLQISIGVACCPQHGRTLEEALLLADVALLRAKEGGGNRCSLFNDAVDAQVLATRGHGNGLSRRPAH